MKMTFINNFDSALYGVSDKLKSVLIRLPFNIKSAVQEIRIRKKLPLALTVNNEVLFVDSIGNVQREIKSDLVIADEADVNESFSRICGNSVYAHEEELKNGLVITTHRTVPCVSSPVFPSPVFPSPVFPQLSTNNKFYDINYKKRD